MFSGQSAYGHGLGLETTSIDIDDRKISVTVEMPSNFVESEEKQITISATENKGRINTPNVTFLIGLSHENKMIFRDSFFAADGTLMINVIPTNDNEVKILGEYDDLLEVWHRTESQPIQLIGPVFESSGLYSFEIEIVTIDEPTNIIENSRIFNAGISLAGTANHLQQDLDGNEILFTTKSYFDKISGFNYDAEEKIATFEMPFDWNEATISHIKVVHEEVHFPKDFGEFLSLGYVGKVNGIDLFKSSVTVDDYTEENDRIVHFVLLPDHIKFLKNEMKNNNQTIPENITFTLSTSQEHQFPMVAFTRDEQFQIDLSWEPTQLEPNQPTNFIFTIRDGSSGEPLRNSSYDFVIFQGGQEIHRINGNAVVGGGFEKFTFSEEQTGPSIIRFENIRGTGAETEFGFVVIPEFGNMVFLIFLFSIIPVILFNRNFLKKIF